MDGTEEETVDGVAVDFIKTNTAFVQLSWTIAGTEEEDAQENAPPDENAKPDVNGGQAENDEEKVEDAPDPAAFAYELERADNPHFEEPLTLYEGRDRASFQPGLAEGDYFYRVRAVDESGASGEWSRPLHVEVEYQSMRLAVSLFALGGVVFLATLVLVVAGTVADRKEREAEGS